MSELINKNKYLDLSGLKKYDELIKGLIESGNNELAAAIANLDAKIGNIEIEGSDDKSLAQSIAEIYTSIAEIIEEQVKLENKDQELVNKDEELAAKIQKVADDLEFITGSSSENEATIGEINAALKSLQEEVQTISGSIQGIAETAAADAVAAVVAGAESDFDTLKEVADWIAADKEGSAALQTTVSNHTKSIEAINGELDTLEEKVNADITNLTNHLGDYSHKLGEVDDRLASLEAFEETHESIAISDIEGLFA